MKTVTESIEATIERLNKLKAVVEHERAFNRWYIHGECVNMDHIQFFPKLGDEDRGSIERIQSAKLIALALDPTGNWQRNEKGAWTNGRVYTNGTEFFPIHIHYVEREMTTTPVTLNA